MAKVIFRSTATLKSQALEALEGGRYSFNGCPFTLKELRDLRNLVPADVYAFRNNVAYLRFGDYMFLASEFDPNPSVEDYPSCYEDSETTPEVEEACPMAASDLALVRNLAKGCKLRKPVVRKAPVLRRAPIAKPTLRAAIA